MQKSGDGFFIQSTRFIPAGSEIFVRYGKEYWEVDEEELRRPGTRIVGTLKIFTAEKGDAVNKPHHFRSTFFPVFTAK